MSLTVENQNAYADLVVARDRAAEHVSRLHREIEDLLHRAGLATRAHDPQAATRLYRQVAGRRRTLARVVANYEKAGVL